MNHSGGWRDCIEKRRMDQESCRVNKLATSTKGKISQMYFILYEVIINNRSLFIPFFFLLFHGVWRYLNKTLFASKVD